MQSKPYCIYVRFTRINSIHFVSVKVSNKPHSISSEPSGHCLIASHLCTEGICCPFLQRYSEKGKKSSGSEKNIKQNLKISQNNPDHFRIVTVDGRFLWAEASKRELRWRSIVMSDACNNFHLTSNNFRVVTVDGLFL